MINVKYRNSILITLFSLTLLMLLFQNCSSGEGLYGGSSDDFQLTTPPKVIVSKVSNCVTSASQFIVNEPIYVCIEFAGPAPRYCHAITGAQYCSFDEIVSQAAGWTQLPGDKWIRAFASPTPGNFTSYVEHTDRSVSPGQVSFTVLSQ